MKSAEKVLALGYFDDLYGYLESVLPLATDLTTLLRIKSLVRAAIATIAVSGPRSPRKHRRPSLEKVLPTDDSGCSITETPRTLETIAQIPLQFEQLRLQVVELIDICIVKQEAQGLVGNIITNVSPENQNGNRTSDDLDSW